MSSLTVWATNQLGEASGYWEVFATTSTETTFTVHQGWSSSKSTETTETQQYVLNMQMKSGIGFGPVGASTKVKINST